MTSESKEVKSRLLSPSLAKNSPVLQIIEISSDSEDGVFCQPKASKFVSALQGGNRHHELCSTWEDDVIELTDSESSNSSDLPDMLSPLVRGPRKKGVAGARRQPSSPGFIPLYVDTSDEESDRDCILVLNDPPGCRRPIWNALPSKDQDTTKNNLLLDSPRSTLPEISKATQKSPRKRSGHTAQRAKAEEQIQRQTYAAELFAELNENIFGDRLPKNTSLEWSKRLLTTAGRARWHRSREGVHSTKIELASKILDCNERIRNTLSHEMCHLACWVIDNNPREGHGQLFKSWANKVMYRHPDIHISTRHSYAISYPYEWKCEKCSKIYGRYSKSIRPDECVCGACKAGKLVPLFVEKKPATPKVSCVAAIKPRDSPYLSVGSPTKNVPLMGANDNDILDLVDGLANVSINNKRG